MTKGQRIALISRLINTSVDDCRITLQGYNDATLMCDLLIKCNQMGHTSREQVVRRRIAALIPKKCNSH